MANKYSCWYRNDFYGDKFILAEQYGDLLELPFYYRKDCDLKIETYHKAPVKIKKNMMEYVEWLIIGIFATGKNMTIRQLKSYLLLKNIAISNMVLKEKIECMIQKGMLERNIICDTNDFQQQKEGRKVDRVVGYSLTRKGFILSETLRLPKYSLEIYYKITNGLRGKLSLSMRSILWNQIILNQMLYNPDLQWFRVGGLYRLKQEKFMELPLYVKTRYGEYYFEYLHGMADRVLEKMFSLWMEYMMEQGRAFTFVLVTDQYHVNSIMGQHVNSAKEVGMKVATTVAGDWFKEEAGTIMMLSDHL